MKPYSAIISILAAATSAQFLEQNALCGDNKDCENSCVEGRYHIATDGTDSMHFGCSLQNPMKYSNPDCSFGLKDGAEETASSRLTCDTVGGTLCRKTYGDGETVNYCVMLDKDVAAFKDNCKAASGSARDGNKGATYETLTRDCR
jgi:hypothetical protein